MSGASLASEQTPDLSRVPSFVSVASTDAGATGDDMAAGHSAVAMQVIVQARADVAPTRDAAGGAVVAGEAKTDGDGDGDGVDDDGVDDDDAAAVALAEDDDVVEGSRGAVALLDEEYEALFRVLGSCTTPATLTAVWALLSSLPTAPAVLEAVTQQSPTAVEWRKVLALPKLVLPGVAGDTAREKVVGKSVRRRRGGVAAATLRLHRQQEQAWRCLYALLVVVNTLQQSPADVEVEVEEAVEWKRAFISSGALSVVLQHMSHAPQASPSQLWATKLPRGRPGAPNVHLLPSLIYAPVLSAALTCLACCIEEVSCWGVCVCVCGHVSFPPFTRR